MPIALPAKHPKTLHLEPYWRNNSYAGLLWGRLRGYKWADQDGQCDAEGVFWGAHGWPEALYDWYWTGKKDKLGREIRVPRSSVPELKGKTAFGHLTTEQVSRLRRVEKGRPAGWRYRKMWLHALWCKRFGIVLCFEAKGSVGFEDPANWARYYRSCEAVGITAADQVVMTLSSIPGWRARLRASRAAARQLGLGHPDSLRVVLPRGNAPADLPTLKSTGLVHAVWGSQWNAKPKPPPKGDPVSTSQNGWPALVAGSDKLHTWLIPARNGAINLPLRNGSAGFILAWVALRLAETINPLKGSIADDWGYAYRPVRGYSTTLSNHSSGTAMDLNAAEHPLGKVGTWGVTKTNQIRALIALRRLRGTVRWGGDYHNRKDEMHFEINRDLATCEAVAKELLKTYRGQRLAAANPDQEAVIFS